MSKSELEMTDRSWASLLLILFNQYFGGPIPELLLLWVCFIYNIADFFYYCISVYYEIAKHLKIHMFKIDAKILEEYRKNKSLNKNASGVLTSTIEEEGTMLKSQDLAKDKSQIKSSPSKSRLKKEKSKNK